MTETTIIIGAGHAGGEAAIQLRKTGYAGRIVLLGSEAHAPYERPPLSKDFLAGDMDLHRMYLRQPDFYGEHAIELRLGETATRIDRAARQVHLADGTALSYSDLVLATGADVRRLAVAGADLPGIHVIRTVEDTLGLRAAFTPGARLVVVGGGYIGLEAAAIARKAGLEVTILEAADRLMARVSAPPVSAFFQDLHADAGADICLTRTVVGFTGTAHVTGVRCVDGQLYPADIVIVGIGVVPETTLAAEAGLTVEDGIVVDAHCRTADPHIYAIGDVARHHNALYDASLRLESVQNAMAQARVAALNIAGQAEIYHDVPWFWSNQYDIRLQIAGVGAPGDTQVLRGDAAAPGFSVAHMRDGRLAALEAVNAPRDFMAAKRLIAAQKEVDKTMLADPEIPLKTLL